MMNLRFSFQPASSCLPLSRTKLYEELLQDGQHGPIQHIWLSGGHVFVAINGGKSLVTLDSKTDEYIQEEETSGCLNIDGDVHIVTVLIYPPNSVIVVLENGKLQHWTYRTDFTWKLQTTLQLCSVATATVKSVCLNVSHNTLIWCQKEVTQDAKKNTYCVYRRHIVEDDQHTGSLKLGPVTTLIINSPKCQLYPRGHGVVLLIERVQKQMYLCVLMNTLTGELEVLVDTDRITLPDLTVHTPVHFPHIILSCFSHIKQLQDQSAILQTCYIHDSQKLLMLRKDGSLLSLLPNSEGKSIVTIDLEDFCPDGIVGMVTLSGCVGVVYPKYVRLYSISSGRCVCNLDLQGDECILGVCSTQMGGHQAGIYTHDDLYIIQKCPSTVPSDASLLEMCKFQSEGVRLSYIDQVQRYSSDYSGTLSIDTLREQWIQSLNTPPTTKLVETLDPYLKEYWKLENVLRSGLSEPKLLSEISRPSVPDEVARLLDSKCSIPRSARQSQLLLLTQWYPLEVLDALLVYLHMGEGELSTSQLHRWQCILSLETSELPSSADIGVPLFELICHLLYKYKPSTLMKFLHRGQQVWEKKVGVSAFIRRRHTLLVYERALRCIPEPEHSINQGDAIHTHVHILMTSEVASCLLMSVHLLIKYKRWTESIEMLTEYRDNSKQYPLLYEMVLSALTQNHVLHKFADQIFPLMPTFTSCETSLQGDNSDIPVEMFCDRPDSISVDSVRPHLLHILERDDT